MTSVEPSPIAGRGSLRQIFGAYGLALASCRRQAGLLVAFTAISGLLEGFALTALVPALNVGVNRAHSSGTVAKLLGLGAHASRDAVVGRSLAAFALLGAASALSTFVVDRLTITVRFQVEADLRESMARSLLGMQWLPFMNLRLGDINKTTLLDGTQTAYGVAAMLKVMGTALVIAFMVTVAALLSPTMVIFTLAFAFVAVSAYHLASGRASAHSAQLSVVADDLAHETSEVFGSFKYLTASGLKGAALVRLQNLTKRFQSGSVRSFTPQTVVRLVYEGTGVVFVAGFIAFALLGASQPVGTSLVFLTIFYRLAPRITALNESLYLARVNYPWYASWRRVFEKATTAEDVQGGTRAVGPVDEVRLDRVSFAYPARDAVLEDVMLTLTKGTCTAVVGTSGSGKTTLLDLLTGVLYPTQGLVLVDGVSLSELDRDMWAQRLGLVFQDSPLFSGTVAENVALGVDAVDRDRIAWCLEMAAAERFVAALPEGLDTFIGERASKLSGGQRQRLALARALYRDPSLLCLDEATNAVDGESERLILDAIQRIKADRIVVLVSHQLQKLDFVDQVVVLEGGHVAEQGSWTSLMSRPSRLTTMLSNLEPRR